MSLNWVYLLNFFYQPKIVGLEPSFRKWKIIIIDAFKRLALMTSEFIQLKTLQRGCNFFIGPFKRLTPKEVQKNYPQKVVLVDPVVSLKEILWGRTVE